MESPLPTCLIASNTAIRVAPLLAIYARIDLAQRETAVANLLAIRQCSNLANQRFLFDAARRARVEQKGTLPVPTPIRRLRRTGRVKSATFFTRRHRSRTEPRAARRTGQGREPLPVGAREHGEYGEEPPFDATCAPWHLPLELSGGTTYNRPRK